MKSLTDLMYNPLPDGQRKICSFPRSDCNEEKNWSSLSVTLHTKDRLFQQLWSDLPHPQIVLWTPETAINFMRVPSHLKYSPKGHLGSIISSHDYKCFHLRTNSVCPFLTLLYLKGAIAPNMQHRPLLRLKFHSPKPNQNFLFLFQFLLLFQVMRN